MSKRINILTICYVIFLVMLFGSATFSGILSEAVYYLGFIIPIAIALISCRGEESDPKKYLTIDADGIRLSWPVVFPTISLTILLSYLTSLLIFAITGQTNNVDLGDSYILAMITHALAPAIFEEALFRYVPMRLLAPYSKMGAIFISAFFFSLVHLDLFTIPYAFIGGVIFMAIDLATESVIPSVVIHFINNALSVSMFFAPYEHVMILTYIWLGLLTLVSVLAINRDRDDYWLALLMLNEKGEGARFTVGMLLFALLTMTVAVVNLL